MTQEESEMNLLVFERDIYNGVCLDSTKQGSLTHFEERLQKSLNVWKENEVTGIWMKISSCDSSIIPICVQHGFEFHHAQPGYVMMTRWLPEDRPNLLPPFATQYLGCAGFVVNSRNQVLVIKERFAPHEACWKLPGGAADAGEDIADAAIRETREETGVVTEFVSVMFFRHMHGFRYGCGDIYFVCLLKPTNEEISKDDYEILDCKWIDIEEWRKDPEMNFVNRFCCDLYLESQKGESQLFQITPYDLSWGNETVTNLVYSAPRPRMCNWI